MSLTVNNLTFRLNSVIVINMYQLICKHCSNVIITKDKRQKFCSRICSAKFNNIGRIPPNEETKNKIRNGVKQYYINHPEKIKVGDALSKLVGNSTKGKYKGEIKSILDVSKRTASKILKRLNIGCCVCGWNEASCDIHHINGKKVENCNGHWNLTCVCPNHHRMFHNKKIDKNIFIPLDKYFPENWNDLYYG